MKYFASRLSDNIAETPEGYLLCLNVPIGRTGEMEYAEGETPIKPGEDGISRISRDEAEVFRPETMASFEGKPLTIKHPTDFVSPENWKELAKGIMQNVRRGEGENKNDLIADILITDRTAILLVRQGMRGLSCGYEAEYVETGKGKGKQVKILGNHLALVDEGRAGESYAIKDEKKGSSMKQKSLVEKFKEMLNGMSKVIDEAAKEDGKEDKAKDEEKEEKEKSKDANMYDELVKVCNEMKAIADSFKPKDEKKDEDKSEDEEGKEDKKEDKAKDGDALEERLKKLEEAVAKLLGSATDEEESMDDEGELMGDEDEEEKAHDTGDTAARAEILSPGIEITKDVKKKALQAAYGTKDGKQVIEQLTGGKAPAFDSAEKVETLFIAASELLKSKRGKEHLGTKVQTTDWQSSIFDQGTSKMTPEKMNEINAKHYSKNK